MMTATLKWSSQLHVAPNSTLSQRLQGDKIILPQSALEALLAAAPIVPIQNGISRNITSSFDSFNPYSFAAEQQARNALSDRQQQLPHPLTFRLVNPRNGRIVYAGIREFSANEGEIVLSPMLRESLGLKQSGLDRSLQATESDTEMSGASTPETDSVTVHYEAVPKGTFLLLRPLEAGYDADDWKSLLERYIRDNMTTLTKGEILIVQASRTEKFRFLIDEIRPESSAICVVDTDLSVDIQAMNEEQAKETLERKLAKAKKAPGTSQGSSVGGELKIDKSSDGQVLPGEYVDFQLKTWDKSKDLIIELTHDEGQEVDIFANPASNYLRTRPRLDEHVFGDFSSRPTKRLRLSKTNVSMDGADHINVSVHGFDAADVGVSSRQASGFKLKATQSDEISNSPNDSEQTELSAEEVVCKNCKQHIPKRTLALHEAFCYRNNVSCPHCQNVFLKSSDAWKTHWHCPHDDSYGSGEITQAKHNTIMHPSSVMHCPSCHDFEAYNIPILAQHQTTTCPAKEILCRFCHLVVPQQGPDDPGLNEAEVVLSGMTPHEYADGARTTECHLCRRIVRLRDMTIHMRLHDRERVGRVAPRLCSNLICGRTIQQGEEDRVNKEQLGLCNDCFGPLYITQFDPEGKALRRRVERRLLQQLMSGCNKAWCQNSEWCRTGHKNSTGADIALTTKDALPRIRPVLDHLAKGSTEGMTFCVDDAAQSRRAIADMIASEGVYEMSWCVKALEAEHNNLVAAQSWLADRAPTITETTGQQIAE